MKIILFLLFYSFTVFARYYNNQQEIFINSIIEIDPYRFTIFRFDNLILGSFLAIVYQKIGNITIGKNYIVVLQTTILIGLLFFGIFINFDNINYLSWGFFPVSLVILLLILISTSDVKNILISNPIIVYMGKISYGIYVFHFPVFLFLERYRQLDSIQNFITIFFIRFLISIVIAILSYELVEKYFLSKKIKHTYN